MLTPLDAFYDEQPEPIRGCVLALRSFILNYHDTMTEVWKYRLPFFCFQDHLFCYLWMDKKKQEPYIGMMKGRKLEHPMLESGARTAVKIMRISPLEDLPIQDIDHIFKMAMQHY